MQFVAGLGTVLAQLCSIDFRLMQIASMGCLFHLSLRPPPLPAEKERKKKKRISLVVQWLRFHASYPGAQVQSLVRELRSHMSGGQIKKKKKVSTDVSLSLPKSDTHHSCSHFTHISSATALLNSGGAEEWSSLSMLRKGERIYITKIY